MARKPYLTPEEKERLRAEYRKELHPPSPAEPPPDLDPELERRRRSECPLTAEEFFESAQPLVLTINGDRRVVPLKQFATGGFGWYLCDKVRIKVGSGENAVEVKVQLGLMFGVINSKPRPEGE